MKRNLLPGLMLAATLCCAPALAAKQDETEGMAGMSGQTRDIYSKTDRKAAARPGQTIQAQPIAPAKGPKGDEKATRGEETAGTAPAAGQATRAK
ncbi:MAG: hypothetical protein JNK22_01070 [Rhodocyclaceae bacterium]|nr:hypothetical protein [Rhodocyclaceae bacterium]